MRSVEEDIPSKAATPAQLTSLTQSFEDAIANGYIGLDVEPEYTPWVTSDEITALARVAAEHGMPVFSHIRASSPDAPNGGSLGALDELLRVADDTGVAVHVDHITSMTTHVMGPAIEKIDAARRRGLDVTACLYPYDFWATTLASERFAPGWQERFGISYGDLEVAGTGERLTEASFEKYQAQNKLVAAHAIPEEDVQAALRSPWTIIGSDAILEPGNNNHPRCSGCFTRTLGRYVRELGVLPLRRCLGQDDDPSGPGAGSTSSRVADQRPAPDRGRCRHHDLRSPDGGRPLDGHRSGADGGGHLVRTGEWPSGQGWRHVEQGRSSGPADPRCHRVTR